MLGVMLVVLMVTATAMFAVYSTTYELRSAGTFRQAMQTQYIAEGGISTGMALVDTMGAGSIDQANHCLNTAVATGGDVTLRNSDISVVQY